MTPSYAVKDGVRYRYYISTPLIQGQPNKAAKLKRIPAVEVETLITSAVRKRLTSASYRKEETESSHSLNDNELISSHIIRVDVKQDHLAVQLALSRESLVIPWAKTAAKRPREIIRPTSISSRHDHRPIRSETRTRLIAAIAKGRVWLDGLINGRITSVEDIAASENCTVRQINMTISLAFLAPSLVQAAVDGRLPRGIGIANLRHAPVEWPLQHARLGLASKTS